MSRSKRRLDGGERFVHITELGLDTFIRVRELGYFGARRRRTSSFQNRPRTSVGLAAVGRRTTCEIFCGPLDGALDDLRGRFILVERRTGFRMNFVQAPFDRCPDLGQ